MSKLFITGGAGFIGAHTACTLFDSGEEVIVFDSFHLSGVLRSPTFTENIQYRLEYLLRGTSMIPGNLEDKGRLRRDLQEVGPDYIIHLAAMADARTAVHDTEAAFRTIVGGTVNLLEAARDLEGLRKFVYVSSSMIYGDFNKIPMPEDAEKNPKDIYGGMKLAAEILVKVFCSHFGIPYAIVRPSAVYGPSNNNSSVLKIFVENAIRAAPIVVTNPDSTFLDFTYVKDVARGLALITLSPEAVNDEFNLTRGEGRSLGEAVAILRRFFPDLQVEVKIEGDGFWPNRGALDINRARQLAGYNPSFALEQGLAEYIDFVREHNPSLSRQT